jgi:hypothetical protein
MWDDDAGTYYDTLSDSACARLRDDLLVLIRRVADGVHRNTFMIVGSSDDDLARLLVAETRDEDGAAMPPSTSFVLVVALDDALRRISDILSKPMYTDIARHAFPPKVPPTVYTVNGYHFTVPADLDGSVRPTEDPAFSVLLNSLDALFVDLTGGSLSLLTPLGRLVAAELFKKVFRSIAHTLVNNTVDRRRGPQDGAACSTLRIATVREAMHFKLAVSMLENWLELHGLFLSARGELLPCRQFCDLLILQKKILRNLECREECTSTLPPQLVLRLLQQYKPNAKDFELDAVPDEVIREFERAAQDARRKSSVPTKTRLTQPMEEDDIPLLPLYLLGSFNFTEFFVTLLPEQAIPERILDWLIPLRHSKHRESSSWLKNGCLNVLLHRALNWDVNGRVLSNHKESELLFPEISMIDSGEPLTEQQDRELRRKISARLVEVSLPDEEEIMRAVPQA